MGEKFEKLVRDNIPKILDSKNVPYEQRTATPEEYKEELIKKLGEELKEFLESKTIEEFTDIDTVMDALKNLPEFKDWQSVKAQKSLEKGDFEDRIILKGEK